ncbi:unnamed protein product [Moneuplotes crassus]|uniref:Uncharacterized protein n=1 Tax=Euplotes crassus TaxID=5936 RepID=A0AAD1TZY4_EUPCR|nr:unnamed protein product [Moneuplotes crassus]
MKKSKTNKKLFVCLNCTIKGHKEGNANTNYIIKDDLFEPHLDHEIIILLPARIKKAEVVDTETKKSTEQNSKTSEVPIMTSELALSKVNNIRKELDQFERYFGAPSLTESAAQDSMPPKCPRVTFGKIKDTSVLHSTQIQSSSPIKVAGKSKSDPIELDESQSDDLASREEEKEIELGDKSQQLSDENGGNLPSCKDSEISLVISKEKHPLKKSEGKRKRLNEDLKDCFEQADPLNDSELSFILQENREKDIYKKRKNKEFDKCSHIVDEIPTISRGDIKTCSEIKNSDMISIGQDKNLISLNIKYFEDHKTFYGEEKEIETKFEVLPKSTIVILAKGVNPGMYILHAGKPCNQHFYLNTDKHKTYFSSYCWEQLEFKKGCLRYASAAYDNKNSIYVTGGSSVQSTAECYVFNTSTQKVTDIKSMNEARDTHSSYLCERENYLYIFGGFSSTKNILVQSIERMNLSADEKTWELIKMEKNSEMLLCSSLSFRPNYTTEGNTFILLGGEIGSESLSYRSVIEIEIVEKDDEMIAHTNRSTFWMDNEDKFNNRVCMPKLYYEHNAFSNQKEIDKEGVSSSLTTKLSSPFQQNISFVVSGTNSLYQICSKDCTDSLTSKNSSSH